MAPLLADLPGQVKVWQEIFGGGPVAAFLGLMIVALASVFYLYTRANAKFSQEQRDHLETVRTCTALTAATQHTWDAQVRKDAEQVRAWQEATELQSQTVNELRRALDRVEVLMKQSKLG